MMDRYPIAQAVVFAALAAAGCALAVLAPGFAGDEAAAVTAIGAALVGGALAFFLLEVFGWDRDRRRA